MAPDVSLDIDFTASLPPSHRTGGGGRTAVEWETLLDPVRDRPGKPAKIAEFEDKESDGKVVTAQAQATSRATVILNRLHTARPMEEWKFNTRKFTNSDGKEVVGVWTTFLREMTPEQFAEYDKKRSQRGERIRAGRLAGKASAESSNRTVGPATEGASGTNAAAEKVRRAREAKQ